MFLSSLRVAARSSVRHNAAQTTAVVEQNTESLRQKVGRPIFSKTRDQHTTCGSMVPRIIGGEIVIVVLVADTTSIEGLSCP